MLLSLLKASISNGYWISLFLAFSFSANAEIVTDGTVGPVQTLNGPAFVVPEALGLRMGANLFHSFQYFNIANGEQATFTGSASIANVVSRVTGGQPTTINGLLRSTVGQADFYFLNPAGVVFGSNAQVDVPASFYVSTANELRFSDGSVYKAINQAVSTLSIDQPQSFGFLGDQTASISVNQSSLVLNAGNTLSFSSNALQIDNAQLQINTGNVSLVAVGDIAAAVTTAADVSQAAEGKLAISNSVINVNGEGGGKIIIRSGVSQIKGSAVSADNSGVSNAAAVQGIDIHATTLDIANSLITTDSLASAYNAADISLTVTGKLTIDNGGVIRSLSVFSGDAGNILLDAGDILIEGSSSALFNGAVNGSAAVGKISLVADTSLSVLNGATILSASIDSARTETLNFKAKTILIDNSASIISRTVGIANAGDIVISAQDSVQISNSAKVTNVTGFNSKGSAGDVRVDTQNFTLEGQNTIIGSASLGDGDSGKVIVNASDKANILNGAVLSSDAFFKGQGGEIVVRANTLTLNGQGLTTGISSSTSGISDAGSVTIDVNDLAILDGAGIVSGAADISGFTQLVNSPATGNAGIINIQANNFYINSGTVSIDSDVITQPSLVTLISPAAINITATNMRVIDSTISTKSTGNVTAGNINIKVNQLLHIDPSIISTEANNANGGIISIQARVIDLQDSQITTSVSGQGDGGDINLVSNVLVLDSGFVQANTRGLNARGGNISIDTAALVTSHNAVLTGGNVALSFQSGLNVIQAAAAQGINGDINISKPELDISGDLIDLESVLVDVDDLVKNPCRPTAGKQSTLVNLGRGGLAESFEQMGVISVSTQRLQRLLSMVPADISPLSQADFLSTQQAIETKIELASVDSYCY